MRSAISTLQRATAAARRIWSNWRLPAIPLWALFALLYAVPPNLPFWIARGEFGFLRDGWFCLEFAGVGLLALFLPSYLAAALLLTAITADLVCGVCRSFFVSVTECFSNFDVVRSLTGERMAAMCAVVLFAFAVTAAAAAFPNRKMRGSQRLRAAMCLVAFGAVTLLADCVSIVRSTGHVPNPLRSMKTRVLDLVQPAYFSDPRLTRVFAARLLRIELDYADLLASEKASEAMPVPAPSATERALRESGFWKQMPVEERPNLVIVLLESWGQSADPAVRQALVNPYADAGLQARYRVVQGAVPFYGGTVAGEARELCGTSIGFHLLNAAPYEVRDCLPSRLALLGYSRLALHGMDGHMFNRVNWYPHMSFEESLFNQQFKQQGLPNCLGAFIGTCDAAIATWIGRRLGQPNTPPTLIHWVTLNSHLPVLAPSPQTVQTRCAATTTLAASESLCSWSQLVGDVHASVARLAMANLSRPTIFVVVGDHAPPFADPALRGLFSSAEVPYVLLLPRPPVR